MARSSFGGTYQDWLFNTSASGPSRSPFLALKTTSTVLTFWSTWDGSGAPSGQYTDLLDQNGNPATSITCASYQIPRFSGPDGIIGMWAWDGTGTDLFWMEARNGAAGGFTEDPADPGYFIPGTGGGLLIEDAADPGFYVPYLGANVYSGSGAPNGVVTASVGSLFLRTNGGAGTTLYVKESGTGNTGWIAK